MSEIYCETLALCALCVVFVRYLLTYLLNMKYVSEFACGIMRSRFLSNLSEHFLRRIDKVESAVGCKCTSNKMSSFLIEFLCAQGNEVLKSFEAPGLPLTGTYEREAEELFNALITLQDVKGYEEPETYFPYSNVKNC